jgi:hypothetical protein
MPSPGAATDAPKGHQLVTAYEEEPQGPFKMSINTLYQTTPIIFYTVACVSGLLNIGSLVVNMPGVRQKVHDLRCKIMAYLVRKQRASSSQALVLVLKLAGWMIVSVSTAARLRRAAQSAGVPSLLSNVPSMIAVKRALKFDDQAEAPDVLESEADSERSERESESDADEHAEPATDWDTFWTRKPTRDMIRTLSSQEVESNKTDLTVARLDEWMLKFPSFFF